MEPDERRHAHYVTLRLPDALPRAVVSAWHDDVDRRLHALRGMKGRDLSHEEEQGLVQRTLGRVERFLDSGRGNCLLRDERAAGAVESVLWSGDGDRYRLHAWCVMPNHVHALFTPIGLTTAEEVLTDWKSESARRVNQELRRTGPLWHADTIDHSVEEPAEFARLRAGIVANPEGAGLTEWPFVGAESRPRPAASVA